jgi:hypothetical protein
MMNYSNVPSTASTTYDRTSTASDNYSDYCKPYLYIDLNKLWQRLEQLRNSKAWVRAPLKILPHFSRKYYFLFNRKIAPPFWTGKNFRKIHKG